MKAEYKDDMFIVINRKHIDRMNKRFNDCGGRGGHPDVLRLTTALSLFAKSYRFEFGEELNQKYYVCNQDEPYSDQVLKIILDGESKKCTS